MVQREHRLGKPALSFRGLEASVIPETSKSWDIKKVPCAWRQEFLSLVSSP